MRRRIIMVSSKWTKEAERPTIEPPIQRLLAQAINSPIKLQLILLFHDNPNLGGSASQMNQRIYRDIWSTRDALRELADDGILSVSGSSDEPIYSYRPRTEHCAPIERLVERFDDPFVRDQIYARLRELATDTLYRRSLAHGRAEATACPCCCPPLYDSIGSIAS
jgi:hypothetical protein